MTNMKGGQRKLKPPARRSAAKSKPTQQKGIQALWKATDARFEETRRMISGLACESRAMLSYTAANEEYQKLQDKRIRELGNMIERLVMDLQPPPNAR